MKERKNNIHDIYFIYCRVPARWGLQVRVSLARHNILYIIIYIYYYYINYMNKMTQDNCRIGYTKSQAWILKVPRCFITKKYFQAFLGLNGGGHSHSDSSSLGEAGGDEHDEMSGVLMGVTALTGMYLFFIMERLMVIITHWKHKKRKAVSVF